MRIRSSHFVLLTTLAAIFCCGAANALASDWPTWRHDSGRSAATDEQLPGDLHLQWSRQLPALTPAWPEDPRLQFDASYQPIVLGQLMFVASSVNDSVTAYDTATGKQQWRFFADGPVRFAPIGAEGRIYFGADDGCVYCLEATTGRQLWKFNAAPNARKVIGNDRLISVWPVRGGPVLDNGAIYFTAGVWPFEGNFLYALNAQTGKPISVAASGDHHPVVLDSRTPQGYLAVSGAKLFVPCGRATVACFNRTSGKFESYSYSTSRVTNYHVSVTGEWLFHGQVPYDMKHKSTLPIKTDKPIITPDALYSAAGDKVTAYNLAEPQIIKGKDRRGAPTEKRTLKATWSATPENLPAGTGALRLHIKAGNRLFGHRDNQVVAIDLPAEGAANVGWKATTPSDPTAMLAADGKLFVVTDEGMLLCYGREKKSPVTHQLPSSVAKSTDDAFQKRAARILAQQGAKDGYCLVVGVGSGRLIEELLAGSNLRVIGVDENADKINELRSRFDANGVYGTRVSLLSGELQELSLPPYFANVITAEETPAVDSASVKNLYACLRPYGGVAVLDLNDAQHAGLAAQAQPVVLPGAKATRSGTQTTLTRVGALAGSADWTHEYGDPSNTLMSRDDLVKPPLGVLWFGGPASSGDLFYNRHWWGPSMAVINGRMFIQGPGKMTAVDVYTGRILWQQALKYAEENYNPGRRGNNFENKITGFHFLAVKDSIYLVQGKECLRLDPQSGKELARFKLPKPDDAWGRIRVQGDILLATAFRKEGMLGNLPKELVAMDRMTGEVLWTKEANLSFPFVAIGKDRVFTFDGALENLYRDWSRKGLPPAANDVRQLKALDLETGKPVWDASTDQVVTWLSYSAEHDVLITSNKRGVAARTGEDGKELWQRTAEGVGFRGHPESYWDKVIVWQDRVIDQRGPGLAYNIHTGKPAQRPHPITGDSINWEFTKSGHHCNYAIANPHMLTFRAASAGFCEIDSGNTARLEGYRSGCRNSLIPANGVLNSPNFAHGCVCGYSLFTSLALTHLPNNEMWGYNAIKAGSGPVEHLGVNFGAPGDRTSTDGVLWLDYPNRGGSSPPVAVKVTGGSKVFHQHSAFLQADEVAWVAASGIEGPATVSVPLGNKEPREYVVRLHFAEPTAKAPGERTFDVQLEGETVLTALDIFKEAGGANQAVVKQFTVTVQGNLDIAFTPKTGKPLLCGVEVVAK